MVATALLLLFMSSLHPVYTAVNKEYLSDKPVIFRRVESAFCRCIG